MVCDMKIVVGIDEAGYGPNLGPLCLGGSAWLLPKELEVTSLDSLLYPVFQAKSSEKFPIAWIPLGDSKKLYRSGSSLESLSLGLSTFFRIQQKNSIDLLENTRPQGGAANLRFIPWYGNQPSAWSREFMPNLEELLAPHLLEKAISQFQSLTIELLGIESLAFSEAEFNRIVDACGNKATLLSMSSLEWIRDWLSRLRQSHPSITSFEIFCDKHGGRNKYLGPLMQVFPDTWFETEIESSNLSRYRGTIFDAQCQWSFTAKGDSITPSSVASMAAKWTREVLMSRLNSYWGSMIANLKPTAGYPVDAKRFAESIEGKTKELGFVREQWWRKV